MTDIYQVELLYAYGSSKGTIRSIVSSKGSISVVTVDVVSEAALNGCWSCCRLVAQIVSTFSQMTG